MGFSKTKPVLDLEKETGMNNSEIANSIAVSNGLSRITKLEDAATTVVALGASILSGTVSFFETSIRNEWKRYGLDLTVVNETTGGDDLADAFATWESIKSTYTGNAGVIVAIHALGNTVSANRPYSSMSQTQKAWVSNTYIKLIKSIENNGNIPLPIATSFRNYDGTTLNNEAEGSLPYNDNVLLDISKRTGLSTYMAGSVYSDWYEFTRNISPVLQSVDGVHWDSEGYFLLRGFFVRSVASFVKGLPPYSVARIESPPTERQPVGGLIRFDGAHGASGTVMGLMALDSSSSVQGQECRDLLALQPSNITADVTIGSSGSAFAFSSTGNITNLYEQDYSPTLTCDYVRWKYLFTQSSDFSEFLVLKGFNAGQVVRVGIAGYKYTTVTDSAKIGEFTVDSGATIHEINASTFDNPYPIIYFDAVADGNGEIHFEGRVKRGVVCVYQRRDVGSIALKVQS